jgi:Fic family protein
LPPKLELDLPLVHALSAADRALGELAGLGRNLPNPHLLIHPFIRREAVLSSRIEGTQADIADLYAYEADQMLLPGISPRVPVGDVREVLN